MGNRTGSWERLSQSGVRKKERTEKVLFRSLLRLLLVDRFVRVVKRHVTELSEQVLQLRRNVSSKESI